MERKRQAQQLLQTARAAAPSVAAMVLSVLLRPSVQLASVRSSARLSIRAARTSRKASPVLQLPPVATITTTTLPDATVGVAYSQQVTATGGYGALTFSATGLPGGLSISSSGLVSGTPTTPDPADGFTVRVTDAAGRWVEQAYTIAVISGETVDDFERADSAALTGDGFTWNELASGLAWKILSGKANATDGTSAAILSQALLKDGSNQITFEWKGVRAAALADYALCFSLTEEDDRGFAGIWGVGPAGGNGYLVYALFGSGQRVTIGRLHSGAPADVATSGGSDLAPMLTGPVDVKIVLTIGATETTIDVYTNSGSGYALSVTYADSHANRKTFASGAYAGMLSFTTCDLTIEEVATPN